MSITSLFAQMSPYMDYPVATTEPTPDGLGIVATLVLILVVSTILIVGYVLRAIFLMRLFKKAGVEQWAAWVPYFNTWRLLEIGGQQGFWAVIALIPFGDIVSAVFVYIAQYNIGLKLGKKGSFVLWAIFLPIVWLIWLAVDKSKWDDAQGVPSRVAKKVAETTPETPEATEATETTA